MRIDERRMFDLFSDINGVHRNVEFGVTRLGFTQDEEAAKGICKQAMEEAGLAVRIDAFGNFIGRLEGADPTLPAVMTGSHVDSVPNGGQYDGVAGVVTAIEAVRTLMDLDVVPQHPIEVVVFSCEESARFGQATLGSRAMIGDLSLDQLYLYGDAGGVRLADAMRELDLDPENIETAARSSDSLRAFIEVHVEQARNLERANRSVGIVTHIAGPIRLKVKVGGEAAHSGATPMPVRRDALAGAAEIVLAVERLALRESPQGTVGTVGQLLVSPGAMNVIPGSAELGIDIRGVNKDSRDLVAEQIKESIYHIAKERGLKVGIDVIGSSDPVALSETVQQAIATECEALGIEPMYLPSAAGHDAMNMQQITESGMIFVPSLNGVSHNPQEYTDWEHLASAAEILLGVLMRLAQCDQEDNQRGVKRFAG